VRIDALVPGLLPELSRPEERNQGAGESRIQANGSGADDRGGLVSAPDRAEFGEAGSDPGQGGKGSLTEEERRALRDMQARDREVRAHEAAHKAAAGNLARGGASFETEKGPDGKSYAVGGEVSIDTSPVSGDPQATINKMQQVRRAALAPRDPSGQDRKVAASAASREAQARAELRAQREEETPAGRKTESSDQDPDSRGLDSYRRMAENAPATTLLNLFV